MNALATIEAAAPAITRDAWVETGRDLVAQHQQSAWRVGDWLKQGRDAGFINQLGFDFLSDELGVSPKFVKTAMKVADAFPPHMRDTGLTWGHHEAAAGLPTTDALAVLKQAKDAHLDERETRVEAVKRRAEIQPSLGREIDWPYHRLMELQRAWNRADDDTRQEFYDAVTDAKMGEIDL